MAITYTQLCGMPRLERSSTAPEKREIFVIHMLSLYTPFVAAFLFDSRLTLTDSLATDIALGGTALASGPFGSGICESRWRGSIREKYFSRDTT